MAHNKKQSKIHAPNSTQKPQLKKPQHVSDNASGNTEDENQDNLDSDHEDINTKNSEIRSNSEEEGEIKDELPSSNNNPNKEAPSKKQNFSKDLKLNQLKKKYYDYERNLRKIKKNIHLANTNVNEDSKKSLPMAELQKKKLKNKKIFFEKKMSFYKEKIEKYSGRSPKKDSYEKSRYKNRSPVRQIIDERSPHMKRDKVNISSNKSISSESNANSIENSKLNNKVKLPYPVLNDKRDKNTVLNILQEKQVHLEEMLNQTLNTLKNLEDENIDGIQNINEEINIKFKRLKSLEANIKIQLARLKKQIEYIKLSIELVRVNQKIEQDSKYLSLEQLEFMKKKSFDLKNQTELIRKFMHDKNFEFLNQNKSSLQNAQNPPPDNFDQLDVKTTLSAPENLKKQNQPYEALRSNQNVPPLHHESELKRSFHNNKETDANKFAQNQVNSNVDKNNLNTVTFDL